MHIRPRARARAHARAQTHTCTYMHTHALARDHTHPRTYTCLRTCTPSIRTDPDRLGKTATDSLGTDSDRPGPTGTNRLKLTRTDSEGPGATDGLADPPCARAARRPPEHDSCVTRISGLGSARRGPADHSPDPSHPSESLIRVTRRRRPPPPPPPGEGRESVCRRPPSRSESVRVGPSRSESVRVNARLNTAAVARGPRGRCRVSMLIFSVCADKRDLNVTTSLKPEGEDDRAPSAARPADL